MKFAVCPNCGARVRQYNEISKTGLCASCNKEIMVTFTNDIDAYYGYMKDNNLLKESSSGGAGTILAEIFLEQFEGVIFGVRWREDFRGARYTYIENNSELFLLKGSKYVDAERMIPYKGRNLSVFSVVEDFLKKDRKVLFFGLGCDVYALKSYLSRHATSDDNLFVVALLCGGNTYKDVMNQYIERLEKNYKSKIIEFSVRYKKYGWKPPYLRAVFENNKVFSIPFYYSEFGYAFNHMGKEECYNCKFKGANYYSDLTIGDYWGCEKSSSKFNPLGMSVIIIQNSKGKLLLDHIDKGRFVLEKANLERAFKDNTYFRKKIKDSKYHLFRNVYEKKDIFVATRSVMGNLKYMIMKSGLLNLRDIVKYYIKSTFIFRD